LLIATDKDTPETAKEYLSVVRLDPMQVRFRVHYNPSQPLRISGWAARLQTLLVVNGGYFTPEYETTNLLISDGETWGVIPGNYAGFFAVTADGQADVRWLQDHPYDPTESVEQGLMSFPVLIKTGGEMGFPAEADNGMHARRTVVAQDTTGQILFIVVPQDTFSLHEMAVFLAECDMEIDVALNLDGGPSTGLWLQSEAHPINIDSRAAIPSVISIEAR
jgi:exopolysaccharide biosynthesis protein